MLLQDQWPRIITLTGTYMSDYLVERRHMHSRATTNEPGVFDFIVSLHYKVEM